MCIRDRLWLVAEIGKMLGDRADPQRDLATSSRRLAYKVGIFALALVVGLAFGALALWGAACLLKSWMHAESEPPVMLVTFGPPAFLVAFGVSTTVFIGIVGRVYYERAREWWSRLNAWFTTLAAAWIVWCLYAFFSLPLMY